MAHRQSEEMAPFYGFWHTQLTGFIHFTGDRQNYRMEPLHGRSTSDRMKPFHRRSASGRIGSFHVRSAEDRTEPFHGRSANDGVGPFHRRELSPRCYGKTKLERSYFKLSGGILQGKILPSQSPMPLARGGALCVLVVCSRSHGSETPLPDGPGNGPGNGSGNGSETGAVACSN